MSADQAFAILEGIGEAMIVLDRDMRVTWWNAAAERATGVRRADVLHQHLFERFPRLAGTPAEDALREVATRRVPRAFNGWHYRGSGADSGGIYDARVWPMDNGGLLLL